MTQAEIRKNILKMANRAKSPHIGSALSCVDILYTLYFKILKLENYEQRDIFLLSKAHAAMALYATLNAKGFMSNEEILGYYQNNGTLPAHTDRFSSPYVEISTGSLGHALPISVGMAMSIKNENRKVYVLIGDGETQEGSIWEAAMLAPKLNLNNLCVLIDYNNLQGYGRAREITSFEPIDKKWESFGWECVIVDGHDVQALQKAMSIKTDKPLCIVCKTIKGKGVEFMENELKWHYYIVTDEILNSALKVLK
ncbi:transketolase [Campylobacter fetus]|nr:transketolase [Campylobacter fetus]EJU9540907.1 transketolase [Campylobacter fetus]